MAFIINLIIQIVIALLMSLIFSRPVQSNVKPAGISDFKFPTATQSRPIPVLWGSTEFKAPNVTWAGDFYIYEVKKKIKSGFSSKKVTVGFRYYIGMQMVLCMGGSRATQGVNHLSKMRFGEKEAWTGHAIADSVNLVNEPWLFGGDEKGGGIQGYFKFYNGKNDQLADPYLEEQIGGQVPSRAGVSHVVWYGGSKTVYEEELQGNIRSGLVSNSTNLRTMWFTGHRYPNTLNVTGGKHAISGGANPACMIHELLTEADWGMGWSESEFSVDDLLVMADTLYDEDFGLSMLWDNERSIKAVLDDIMEHISGYYYEDKQTGMIRFGLMRQDYDTELLDTLAKPTVIEVEEFTRSTWEGSMNEITISYSDPARNYDLNSVTVNDIGNVYIQEKVVSRTNQYHGITSKDIAVRVGFRDLRMLSIPLVRTVLKCNRAVSTWEVGKPFKWSEPEYGIDEMIMRVNKIERGDFLTGEIILHATEDVFTRGDTVFTVPDDDQWTPPSFDAVELDDNVHIEVPVGYSLYPEDDTPELLTLVKNTSTVNTEYDAYFGNVSGALNNDDPESETISDFGTTLTSLRVNDPSYSATATVTVSGLTNEPDVGLGASQESMLYLNGEFIGYDDWAPDADGNIVFTGLYRGMLNTVMQDADVGSDIALLNGAGFIPPLAYDAGEVLYYKLQPFGISATLDLNDITEQSHTFYGEKLRPYVLTNLKVQGEYDYQGLTIDEDIEVTWGNNPKELGAAVDTSDETQALHVDTDYTVDVYSFDGLLGTDTINVLTGSDTQNMVTFLYADLYGAGVQAPPYSWVTVKATAATLDSTYTAVKIFSRPERALERDASMTETAPTGNMVWFDGKLVGIRHGT